MLPLGTDAPKIVRQHLLAPLHARVSVSCRIIANQAVLLLLCIRYVWAAGHISWATSLLRAGAKDLNNLEV